MIIVTLFGFKIHLKLKTNTCRLSGIDTPKIRSKSKEEKIINKLTKVTCGNLNKYGKLLVILNIDNEENSINEWLIKNKYEQVYDGGKKKSWCDFLRLKE